MMLVYLKNGNAENEKRDAYAELTLDFLMFLYRNQ